MSEMLDSYTRQFFELSDKISRMSVSVVLIRGEEQIQMLREIKDGLGEARSLIRKVTLEAQNWKQKAKEKLAAGDGFAARDELMEGGMVDSNSFSTEQRGRLLTAIEQVNQSGDRMKDGERTLLEAESLYVSALAELQSLQSQRETFLHAREMNRNKLIGWSFIIVPMLVILVVLYLKLILLTSK